MASDKVKKWYKNLHDFRNARPKFPDLIAVLRSEIGTYSKVYIVVDALDECLECDQANVLKTLRSPADVNLVMSRPLLSMEQEFQGVGRLDISANSSDQYGDISKIKFQTRID